MAVAVRKQLTKYNFTNRNDTGRIKYIVVHYLGGVYSAAAQARSWASKYVGASAHYIIGHEGEIYQSVEDADIAWHCGASKYKHKLCRNTNSIGIEMAVRKRSTATMSASDPDWYFEAATEQSLVDLVVEKMRQYGIPIENVLRHYDVTGKICPSPYVMQDGLWDGFLGRVRAALGGTVQPPQDEPQDKTDGSGTGPEGASADAVKECDGSVVVVYNGRDGLNLRTAPNTKSSVAAIARCGDVHIINGITADGKWYRTDRGLYVSSSGKYVRFTEAIMVKVTDPALNIRSAPNTSQPPVGVIKDFGTYTIVYTEGDWGLLKSGKGWIRLKYTKRI